MIWCDVWYDMLRNNVITLGAVHKTFRRWDMHTVVHCCNGMSDTAIQADPSLSPQIPWESNVHAVFERDPEILRTCFMCPCRALHDFFFPARYLGFCIFLGYLGLKGSHISSEKKQNIRKGLGRGTRNTCAKCQGLPLKNGVDIWTFVR